MSTTGTKPTALDAEARTGADAVVAAAMAGKSPDPEIVRRVRERGDRITERLRRTYGEPDIGVPAIRQLRGELPQ